MPKYKFFQHKSWAQRESANNGEILTVGSVLIGCAALDALVKGLRQRALWFSVTALIFLAGGQGMTRFQDTGLQSVNSTTTGGERGATGPTLTELALQDQCQGVDLSPEGSALQLKVGGVRYVLVAMESYQGEDSRVADPVTMTDVVLAVRNEEFVPVWANPWFDFWIMPHPTASGLPYGPQPHEVDILTHDGRVWLGTGESVRLEPGMSCTFRLSFLLAQDAERATLFVGYIAAFNLSLEARRPSQE